MAKMNHPPPEHDLDSILADLQSPDEVTRAKAVRSICPCRMGWDVFQQTMAFADQLRKDPSPIVRRAALHAFEDAYEMDSSGLPTSRQETKNEMLAKKRRMRASRDG
jgi:vesicle coat complex subunit